jgi:hypothetical protein
MKQRVHSSSGIGGFMAHLLTESGHLGKTPERPLLRQEQSLDYIEFAH